MFFEMRVWRCLVMVVIACQLSMDAVSADEIKRPNILFVFTDDQPQICLGAMGNPHIETPNMDRLAADGVLFTNAFVTTAICCSNRACILTGQHMRRHNIRDFHTPLSADAFRQTYPARLRQAGYRTGYLGKFAVGWPSKELKQLSLPASQFDHWFGFPQTINFRQESDGKVRYLTTLMEEHAVEFLRSVATSNQPFCLTVALKEPHGPWNYFDPNVPNSYEDVTIPPPPTFTKEDFAAQPNFIQTSLNANGSLKMLDDAEAYQKRTRGYYRLISRADLALGRILAALRETGFEDNTVVIFSSDHGDLMGAHGLMGKWLMYEESIRVPLIIRDPRLPKQLRGRRCAEMALSIDLAPTMLALAQVPIPDSVQGRDLTPLLRGEQLEWRDHWYYEHVYNTNPPRRPIPKCEGVRTRHWKYTRYPESDPPYEQLFDLEADPLERQNLASQAESAEKLAELRSLCDRYRQELE
jgi:arylsulfatase A-like enzyme